jgi:hypothetical protein
MAKHTRSSSQEALLESLKGQNNQLQTDLEKLIEVRGSSQKMTSLVIEQVKIANKGMTEQMAHMQIMLETWADAGFESGGKYRIVIVYRV